VNEHAGIPPAIMDTINLRTAELERMLDDEPLQYRHEAETILR
jgi:hypothetical protein